MSNSKVSSATPVSIAAQTRSRQWTRFALSSLRASKAFLTLCQVLVVAMSGITAKILYIDLYLGSAQSILSYLAPILLLAFIVFVYFERTGLDGLDGLAAPTIGFGRVFAGLSISFLVLLGVLYALKTAEFYSRGWFLCWHMLTVIGLITVRWVFMRHLQKLAESGRLVYQTALFGTSDRVEKIKQLLQETCPFVEITGVYFASKPGEESFADCGLDELQTTAREGYFDRIIIGMPSTEYEGVRSAVKALAPGNAEILLCNNLEPASIPVHGVQTLGRLQAEIVAPIPASERNIILKRVVDVAIAGVGLILLLPLFVIVAVAIKLESRGPVLFLQRRYGRNSKVFQIFKFRSMTVTEDGDHIQQARPNDARVTRVGRVIRTTSIDELPQLINVLIGEMSIVGPRPHAIAHDDNFERQLDLFSRRRRVLPGITGWAQVNGYRGETRELEDVRRRMDYDLYYIDNWSIWLDFEIIARTVVTLLRGAY